MQRHWRLPGDPLSVRRARELVRSFVAQDVTAPETTEAAVLVVSELVSNAILHAASEVGLDIDAGPGGVHLAVHDDSPQAPQSKGSLPGDLGGRGLAIVDRLADRWGWTSLEDDGKEVWCDLLPERRGGHSVTAGTDPLGGTGDPPSMLPTDPFGASVWAL